MVRRLPTQPRIFLWGNSVGKLTPQCQQVAIIVSSHLGQSIPLHFQIRRSLPRSPVRYLIDKLARPITCGAGCSSSGLLDQAFENDRRPSNSLINVKGSLQRIYRSQEIPHTYLFCPSSQIR